MIPVLNIYQTIYNNDTILYPSEVKNILDEILRNNNHSQDDIIMMEIAYSFYKLGFENKNKSKPTSPFSL